MQRVILFASTLFMLFLTFAGASAWTGPTASPPSGNVAAPVNVGTTAQVKNGDFSVNALAIFGNTLLYGAGNPIYFNFGPTAGFSGYGIRDSGGTLEFRNLNGNWANLNTVIQNYLTLNNYQAGGGTFTGSGTTNYMTKFTGATALGNSQIFDNGTNVGIGTAAPGAKLDVQGNFKTNAFYFDGNDDTWLRLRNADNGSYKDFAAGNIYAAGQAYSHGVAVCESNGTNCPAAGAPSWSSITGKPGNLTYWDTWYGSAYLGSNGDYYMGWDGRWLSQTINQDVRNGTNPTFNNVYVNSRGMWMSQTARKDGGQFWVGVPTPDGSSYDLNITCPSGSLMAGEQFHYYNSYKGSGQATAPAQSVNYLLCQWIN